MYVYTEQEPGTTPNGYAFSGPSLEVMGAPTLEVMMGPTQLEVMGPQFEIMGPGVDIMGSGLEVMGPQFDPASAPDLFGLGEAGLPWYWEYNPWRPLVDLVLPVPIPYENETPDWILRNAAHYTRIVTPIIYTTAIHTWVMRPIGAALCAMHGYKRNSNNGASALLWGVLGFLAPVIASTTALVQGYAKLPKSGKKE